MAQRKRRNKGDAIDSSAPSTKRSRYNFDRDFYSLPQCNRPVYHPRYDLRAIEHRKPLENYTQSSQVTTRSSKTKNPPKPCTHITHQPSHPLVTRNAHSYSINALKTRCSNSSTTSGQRGKQQALMTEVGNEVASSSLVNLRPRRKRKITQEELEDVS